MKSIIKLMVVFVCVVSLVACGKKDTTVSANKDGVLYEAGVGVSFYYPSDFKLSEGNPNDGVTRFTKENQILFYKVEENEYDNDTDQLSELYKGELEASEVTLFIPSVFMPAIESELAVGEIEKRYFSLSLNPVWLEVSCKALSLPELSITCDVIPREALFMRSESLLSI